MHLNDENITTSLDETCQIPCFNAELVTRLRKTLPSGDSLEEAQVLFGALADRTRLKILLALREGEELCVCDVAHVLGTTIASASHHLRKLRDLRVLRSRNDGKMSYYALRDPAVAALLNLAFPGAGSSHTGTRRRL